MSRVFFTVLVIAGLSAPPSWASASQAKDKAPQASKVAPREMWPAPIALPPATYRAAEALRHALRRTADKVERLRLVGALIALEADQQIIEQLRHESDLDVVGLCLRYLVSQVRLGAAKAPHNGPAPSPGGLASP